MLFSLAQHSRSQSTQNLEGNSADRNVCPTQERTGASCKDLRASYCNRRGCPIPAGRTGSNNERPALRLKRGALKYRAGDDLLFHKVAPAVPWAQTGLTAVFGMGTGGALSLKPPAKLEFCRCPPFRGGGTDSNLVLTENARKNTKHRLHFTQVRGDHEGPISA